VPDVQLFPPPADAITAMLEIPRTQVAPTIMGTQAGPVGHLGPEEAGAILLLQATFTDPDGATAFWASAVRLMGLLAAAPGFIRRYSFPDDLSITLIALWRTAADAKAFAASPEHRAAVDALYANRWQYTHFSGLWEMTSNHGRVVFCEQCDGITPIGERVCRSCRTELVDVFARASAVVPPPPG
jgi:heme-degrading monooxygenase HmoA